MSKLKVFSFLLIISITGIDGRALRKRRGIWPDVLAPGGNTFAASGYYGMQTNIAYPESGIAFNPYWQGYYPQNQFNNYNPFGYNQPYPYGGGQGIPYTGLGINNGYPYGDQGNYNGYYPNQAGNAWYPPAGNVPGPLPSGIFNSRTGSNIGGPSPAERINRPASAPINPIYN